MNRATMPQVFCGGVRMQGIESRMAPFEDTNVPWYERLKKIDAELSQMGAVIAGWKADANGLAYAKKYLQALEDSRRSLLLRVGS